MKQIKMKQFGVVLLGLSLMAVSCSKEEVEVPMENSEPVIPVTTQELTGVFEGGWSGMLDNTKGKIEVYNGFVSIDELPTKAITDHLIDDIRFAVFDDPELRTFLTDTLGNFFFASSYEYPVTNLLVKYQVDNSQGSSFLASISGIWNGWTYTSTYIQNDFSLDSLIVITPPEPNVISFSVKADGVPYRVDLIRKEDDAAAELNMTTGLWTFQYWYSGYRVLNLKTGRQTSWNVIWSFLRRHKKEDTNLLQFQATKRTGGLPDENLIIYY
ncbi:MAG: hypothetical protein IJ540_07785 [Prevotella sp.]|nr:hypothetical protein [Prevotella sp.]